MAAMPMVFGSTLTLPTFIFFFTFFLAYRLVLRFRVYLLRLVHFYQAYCTLVVCHCYITDGV